MGRLISILTVVWLLGLLLCAQRIVHWSGETEEGMLDYYNQGPNDRYPDDDEFLSSQEAGRMMTVWLTGLVLWGAGGAVVLYLVWRRTEGVTDIPEATQVE
jgi:hypothetical protein